MGNKNIINIFSSSGILCYDSKRQENGYKKLIVQIDKELSSYYRCLVPKYIRLNPQRYQAHISVIRNEIPSKMEHWGKYEGEEINFQYESFIHNDETYFWLNVFCVRLEEIRSELGLSNYSKYTQPPDGFTRCFHSTIGNIKRQ